ncbi:MAG: FAD-binding oxidoreductase, partial [bacterium]
LRKQLHETVKNYITELKAKLGPDKVFDQPDLLKEYSGDWTEIPGHLPDVVVKADAVEDVQLVLRIANDSRTPVVPRVANTNVGGLAIPEKGGIVLDLIGMNRILETNEADKYAIIEPGVTWGHLKTHLAENYPSLRFGYSLSPPHTSVLANCLMDGLTNLSLKHGSSAQWINGLEAVLPTGEMVRTGIGAASSFWCCKAPMPDLTGLFVNFHGTTGVVTRLAVQLWPNHPFRKRFFVLAYDTDEMYDFINLLVRSEVCDDIGGLSWPAGKMLFGEKNPLYKDPAEPEQFLYIDVSAEYEALFQAKLAIVERLIKEQNDQGVRFESPLDIKKLVKIAPRFEKFAEFPAELDFLLELGGLTWIGTFGPTSQWKAGVGRGMALMQQHGFPPIVVTRPMRLGHFGVLRFIAVFDKADKERVRRVKRLNEELSDLVLELGFFPYKTPPWVVRRHRDKIDANYLNLLEKVRNLIDPNQIMNPGKWPV